MKKKIIFFDDAPPKDKKAIHIWLGKTTLPHQKLINQFIKKYTGCTFELATNPNGKPYLSDAQLHFNLSDCSDWFAIAFSWEKPVGIDIEVIRPIDGMRELIDNCFSKAEQAYVNEKDNLRRFWKIWNRKEAALKALGLGLQDDMPDWNCNGSDWIAVRGVFVKSVPVKHNLSMAVAIHE